MSVMFDRRFWRWSRPTRSYRQYRKGYGFSRIYSLILALGFDGVGT